MTGTGRWLLRVLSVLGVVALVAPAARQGGQKPILNCTEWKDTAGRPISAHEHFVGRFDGVFYWYGTSYKGNPMGRCGPDGAALRNGLNVYRSKNLVDWEYAGECLKLPKAKP